MLLALQVFEARNLPDTDRFLLSKLINSKDVTDPYVSGYLDTTKVRIGCYGEDGSSVSCSTDLMPLIRCLTNAFISFPYK